MRGFLIAVPVLFTAISCADVRREYHYFDDMHYSPGGDTAKFDARGKRQYDMLEPENTIAYNSSPKYPYKSDMKDAEVAAKELKVPVSLDLKRGEKKYQIYCAPCHGALGYADGPVKKVFMPIQPLATAPGQAAVRAEAYPIARIYHIATAGQGLMQGYAPQVQEPDRWNIAAYVKNELQKKK